MLGVELFSGCGGLALGLSRAGVGHVLLAERDPHSCATLRANFGSAGTEIVEGDVRERDWTWLRDSVDVLAGGPPCQPFSLGGKHAAHHDSRDMWPEAIRAVRETRPRAFVFENVKGLARSRFRDYLSWIVKSLERPATAGPYVTGAQPRPGPAVSEGVPEYLVTVAKVNCADFGAAQNRERVLVLGVSSGVARNPAALSGERSLDALLWDQWVDGGYWRRHGLTPLEDDRIPSRYRGRVRKMRESGRRPEGLPWRTVRDALVGLGEPDGERGHAYQPGARAYPGHTGSPLDMPSKALKAGAHGVPGGENMMVRDDGSVRYFTVREAARLQGFPDDWMFSGAWSETMRQLGNAVPTEVGEAAGRALADALRG